MDKKTRFIFLFLLTFAQRHKKFILFGWLIGFLFTVFIIQISPFFSQSIKAKQLKIGIIHNSTENNLPQFIQDDISLGITKLMSDGSTSSSLALSWEVSPNGLTYLFKLRNDIIWHDGKKFTAKDIKYRLNGAEFKNSDDYTLQVNLKEPYSPLLVLLSRPIMRPDFIGLGSFKVIKTKYSAETLTDLVVEPINGSSKSITYKLYSNIDDAILGFKLGEINMLKNLPELGSLNSWKNIKITEVPQYDRFTGIFYNLRNSLFKEKEIRQALAYAIPKFDNFENVTTPISPLSWAYSNKTRLYKYDPETAQKILAKSPLASESSQLTISATAPLLNTAQTVADAWNKVGVNAKIRVVTSIPDDYEVLIITQIIPSDPDQYQMWQSTQDSTNISHYSNLKIDKLLEDGRKTFDIDKRKKIYADFQRYLVDDAPVNFLYYPKVYDIEKI